MTAERFTQWVASTGLSQDQVAEQLGCSQAQVSSIMHGRRRPGVDLIHAIERATAGWNGGPIRTEEWVHSDDGGGDGGEHQKSMAPVVVAEGGQS